MRIAPLVVVLAFISILSGCSSRRSFDHWSGPCPRPASVVGAENASFEVFPEPEEVHSFEGVSASGQFMLYTQRIRSQNSRAIHHILNLSSGNSTPFDLKFLDSLKDIYYRVNIGTPMWSPYDDDLLLVEVILAMQDTVHGGLTPSYKLINVTRAGTLVSTVSASTKHITLHSWLPSSSAGNDSLLGFFQSLKDRGQLVLHVQSGKHQVIEPRVYQASKSHRIHQTELPSRRALNGVRYPLLDSMHDGVDISRNEQLLLGRAPVRFAGDSGLSYYGIWIVDLPKLIASHSAPIVSKIHLWRDYCLINNYGEAAFLTDSTIVVPLATPEEKDYLLYEVDLNGKIVRRLTRVEDTTNN